MFFFSYTLHQQQQQLQQQQLQQQQQQHNLFRMQQNVPIQGMQGLPMPNLQAMQGAIGMQGLQQNKFLPIQPNNSQQILAQQKGNNFIFYRKKRPEISPNNIYKKYLFAQVVQLSKAMEYRISLPLTNFHKHFC